MPEQINYMGESQMGSFNNLHIAAPISFTHVDTKKLQCNTSWKTFLRDMVEKEGKKI